jgi:hypothetical protein
LWLRYLRATILNASQGSNFSSPETNLWNKINVQPIAHLDFPQTLMAAARTSRLSRIQGAANSFLGTIIENAVLGEESE